MIETEPLAGENHDSAQQRERVVAYLRYALEDVGALSPVGLRFLQMTIESLSDDFAPTAAARQPAHWVS
jgi:hypothetical protein